MGAMLDRARFSNGMSVRDAIRDRRQSAIGNMASRGGMAGMLGRVVDRVRPESVVSPQPVQPRNEPSLGAMFSSKPNRSMYGGGRQMQKGWWP